MAQADEEPARPVDSVRPTSDALKSQDSVGNSQGQGAVPEAFPVFKQVEPSIRVQARQRKRRCPLCHAPNFPEKGRSIVYCRSCLKPFDWEQAEKVTTKQRPSRSPEAAMMSGKMTEQDPSVDSPNDGSNQAERGLAQGNSASSPTGKRSMEQRPSHVRFAESAKQEDGPSTAAVRRVAPGTEHQQSQDTENPSEEQLTRQSETSGSSSRRQHKSKSSISRRTKHPISKPPPRQHQMRMVPLLDLSAAYGTIASNNEVCKASEAAKGPIRARALELQDYTAWQQIKWRCEMKPCCEFEEGFCYKTSMRSNMARDGVDGTVEGDGEGCCETKCMRWCCAYGFQYCSAGKCCEGGGCVKCCGWEHGFWDALDVCFGEDGCVVKCVGLLPSKWKFW